MRYECYNIKELYDKFVQFPFICTDTRKILPNSLFFCLKGENFDGNLFVNEALEKGAQYVICDKQYITEEKDNDAIIKVDDVLQTLQQLAHYHRRQLKIPIIGITGTNGKTTTKELLACVLSKKYNTAYTQSNLNNHIGVPLTLLSIKKEHEIAIIEMGANHTGEIETLCHIAEPEYGLITNIGKAHLEGFGSVENIIETKTALYRAANVLFVNEENEILRNEVRDMLLKGQTKEIVFFGKNDIHCTPQTNPYLIVELFGHQIQTQLTGNYNIPNMLAAATIGRYFGVTEQDICNAIATYTPTNNRSQIIKNKTNTIIADCYNANPSSMQAALENFLQIEATHKLAILGDMLELGNSSAKEHQALIDFCEANHLETIFIGTHFYSMKNNRFHFFTHAEECNRYLETHKIENTLLLLKGSRGIHLEKITI